MGACVRGRIAVPARQPRQSPFRLDVDPVDGARPVAAPNEPVPTRRSYRAETSDSQVDIPPRPAIAHVTPDLVRIDVELLQVVLAPEFFVRLGETAPASIQSLVLLPSDQNGDAFPSPGELHRVACLRFANQIGKVAARICNRMLFVHEVRLVYIVMYNN